MRTKKNFGSTKEKYIEKIFQIFLDEGYDVATLTLIIKRLGISKGVFYHYFENKEECAKECAKHYAKKYSQIISSKIIELDSAIDQLAQIIVCGAEIARSSSISKINTAENMLFHQMFMVELVKEIAPLYKRIFDSGNKSKQFNVKYTSQVAEMILTLSHFYLDDNFFGWKESDDLDSKVDAVIYLCERMLMIEEGQLKNAIKKYYKK